ncbi:MAG: fibronectin type III domain-containing protein [Ruminococcus sp.]|nr:fibronectin type III domain-containing protein [Ruminococcus sp.]
MKGLMKRAAAMAAACVLSVSALPASVSAFGGVTTVETPREKTDTVLKWATQISVGWSNSPSTPSINGDEIVYVASNKLQALDKNTGAKLEKSGDLAGSFNSYGMVPPLAADGKIFVAMGKGTIQAFDAETFESLWVYHDELGGQSNSEMVYKDGYLYTGFWNSETADANFVCLPTEDTDTENTSEEQAAAWKYTTAGGYYWAGAYVTDDLVVFGTDNGVSDADSKGSKLVAVKKNESIEAGEAVVSSVVSDLFGDLRSAVSYDETTGYYFVTSKGKLLIRFCIEDGNIKNVHSLVLPGASTSTPVAANGRVYIGVGASNAYGEYAGHQIAVIDAEKFEMVYGVQTNGYCQSSALVSDQDGENYVYFTANYTPGKVYVLHDNASMTAPEKTETVTKADGTTVEACPTLFTPVGSHAQYCLCSVMADENGNLFFKNDSGAVFALTSRLDKVEVSGKTLYKEGDTLDKYTVTAVYANGVKKDISDAAIAGEGNAAEALKAGKGEVSFGFDGMEYGDTDTETGHEYDAVFGELEYTVLAAEDYDNMEAAIAAIDAIGEVTLDSKAAIEKARELYDKLSDDAKANVSNYDKLTKAEEDYAKLVDEANKLEQVVIKDKYTCTTGAVRINWNKVENADGYEVFYKNHGTNEYELINDVKADTLTHKEKYLQSARVWKFKVRAYKIVDGKKKYGKFSAVKTTATKPDDAVIVKKNCVCGKKTIKVAYKKVARVDGYQIQKYNASKKAWVTAKWVKKGSTTKAAVSGLKPGKTYKFRVRAYKTVNGSKLFGAFSKTVKLTTKK